MDIATRRFSSNRGWLEALPELDSEQTLVLAFGPADLERAASGIETLRETYPRAAILGCSSAGEILGDTIHDGELCVAIVRFGSTRLRSAKAVIEAPAES